MYSASSTTEETPMSIPKKLELRMAKLRAQEPDLLSPQPIVHRRATEAVLTHVSDQVLLKMKDDTLVLLQRHMEQAVATGMTDEELSQFVLTFQWSPRGAYTAHDGWLKQQREPEPRNNVVTLHATRTG